MHKSVFYVLCLLVLSLTLCSCGDKSAGRAAVAGKVVANPEVSFAKGAEPKGAALPQIPDLSWNFYKEEGKADLVCKLKMKVIFKSDLKCTALISLSDLNRFPVTTEEIKFSGLNGETQNHEIILYITPDMSKRITNGKVEISPI